MNRPLSPFVSSAVETPRRKLKILPTPREHPMLDRKRCGLIVLLAGALLGAGAATIDNWRGGAPLPPETEMPVAP